MDAPNYPCYLRLQKKAKATPLLALSQEVAGGSPENCGLWAPDAALWIYSKPVTS